MTCPKCSGPVIPNPTKTPATPRAPDFLCANPACLNEKGYRSGVWNNENRGGGGGGRKWQPTPRLWKSGQLGDAYEWALKRAESVIVESSKRTKMPFTTADVLNGAATLMIAIAGNVDPRPAAPPTPPPPARQPEPLDQRPAAFGDAKDDDVPW